MSLPPGSMAAGSQSLSGAPQELDTVLLWFRRDLRVADNPALTAALQAAKRVVPVYIFAPEEEGQFQAGRCSRWWLSRSLAALESDLRCLGSRMIFLRSPESRTALLQLVVDTGAQALFFNHLYDTISLVRDNEVKAAMAGRGVLCQSFNADVLYEPWEVLSKDGQPLTSFEEYWNRAMNMPYQPPIPLLVPPSMPGVLKSIIGLDINSLGLTTMEEELSNQQLLYTWQPGSKGAHEGLQKFVLGRLEAFGHDRAKTDRYSTSRLSPHIHFGEISIRHLYYVVKQQELESMEKGTGSTSCRDFLQQVGYREYARYLSFHFPFTHERSLLEHLRACPWRFDQRHFKAWRQGRTGYPLVDAGMRELWSSGWLHNRMRVVCASFLVKNLLLPWQWGLKHYWDALLDADLECDALGWQFCSGCLADAHPFSYMLNQKTEARRFDPDGNYVRRWLPVLARLPIQYIHRPWEAPESILADAGVELGVNYPLPIITMEESETQVVHACSVIEQSLAEVQAAKVPFRPATHAPPSRNGASRGPPRHGSHGRRASDTPGVEGGRSAPSNPRHDTASVQLPDAAQAAQDPSSGQAEALAPGVAAIDPESDEEVVSNHPLSASSPAPAATASTAQQRAPGQDVGRLLQSGAQAQAPAGDAAQQAARDESLAVLPSLSHQAQPAASPPPPCSNGTAAAVQAPLNGQPAPQDAGRNSFEPGSRSSDAVEPAHKRLKCS